MSLFVHFKLQALLYTPQRYMCPSTKSDSIRHTHLTSLALFFAAEMDARPSQGRGFTTDSESDNESSKFNDIVPCIDLDEAEEDQVVLNNRPPGKRKLEAAEEDNNMAEANNLEHLLASVLAQGQRQSESWWQIPDSIYELLPLPKNFDIQLEV